LFYIYHSVRLPNTLGSTLQIEYVKYVDTKKDKNIAAMLPKYPINIIDKNNPEIMIDKNIDILNIKT